MTVDQDRIKREGGVDHVEMLGPNRRRRRPSYRGASQTPRRPRVCGSHWESGLWPTVGQFGGRGSGHQLLATGNRDRHGVRAVSF